MAANRGRLNIIDENAAEQTFDLMPTGQGGRGFALKSVPWQPGDPARPFRVALHPMDGGLGADRLAPASRTVAKSNADTSNSGLILPPPLLSKITLANGNAPVRGIEFNGDMYVIGGRYVYRIGLTNLCTNGSFETDTTGWTTGGTNTIAVSTAQTFVGSQSLKATYTDNTTLADFNVTVTDVVNQMFAWVYVPANWDGGQIQINAVNFTAGATSAGTNANMALTDQWQRIEILINPDAGDLAGTLRILCASAPTATRFIYIDNVEIFIKDEDKDLGAGFAAVDAALFNNQIVVAMGETEKIWTRSTTTWTQATDATYAIALGVVDRYLWRAETTNRLSSCTTAPLTLTSWAPAGTSAYSVGNTSYAVNAIIDYGGIPWAIKGDGAYAPDPQSRFHNQTPQMYRQPNSSNGDGAFVAWGSLWVPTSFDLLRIMPGKSQLRGPSVTARPDFRFWTRAGIEWGDAIYLVCTDEQTSEATFICKMVRDVEGYTGREYRYYEWSRLPSTSKSYFISISSAPTNPTLFVGYANDVYYGKLGRGGGRDIDDPGYMLNSATTIETGRILPGGDLSVVSVLTGVELTLDLKNTTTGAAISSIDYKVDGGSYTNLLTTQEGGGTAAISSTTNFQTIRRYAVANTSGQFFEFRINGTLISGSGTRRPEILEAWAFGELTPAMTDVITVAIAAHDHTTTGQSGAEILRKFRDWMNRGIVLSMELFDYDSGYTTRVKVIDVEMQEKSATRTMMDNVENVKQVMVALKRVNYDGNYAAS